MAKIKVPQNAGKVRVAVASGGRYVVWNGKQGEHEFSIQCRNRKHAQELAKQINVLRGGGEVLLD